jgi:hypothetical protein
MKLFAVSRSTLILLLFTVAVDRTDNNAQHKVNKAKPQQFTETPLLVPSVKHCSHFDTA